MGDARTALIAELGMYPFASVRWAWDALWAEVAAAVPWAPATLAHTGDVHARWDDPSCAVNHVCGWPLASRYTADQRVVGSFALTIPEANGHLYRSTIVARDATPLAERDLHATTAAVNNDDSLSGWISLLAAAGTGDQWPGPVVVTGAHRHSLARVQAGEADLACIDSWSLRLLERDEPEATAGLHTIGTGPVIPTPAITIRQELPDSATRELYQAMSDAVTAPESAVLREALLIDGFVATTLDDYLPVLRLLDH